MAPRQSDETKLAVIQTDVGYIKDSLKEVNQKLSSGYVTKEEHKSALRRLRMLETAVYGVISLIALTVFGAIINTVVNK